MLSYFSPVNSDRRAFGENVRVDSRGFDRQAHAPVDRDVAGNEPVIGIHDENVLGLASHGCNGKESPNRDHTRESARRNGPYDDCPNSSYEPPILEPRHRKASNQYVSAPITTGCATAGRSVPRRRRIDHCFPWRLTRPRPEMAWPEMPQHPGVRLRCENPANRAP